MDQKVGSVNDWMMTYDRNGDGQLDVSELQDLQTRLSKQMTDNIQLTKHLNTLEMRSANHSTELKEKAATLRKALEAMDYSRTVQNELRSKLALTEQNSSMMGAELQEARVQKTISDQRADALENEIEEARMANMDMEQKQARLESENHQLNTQVKNLTQRLDEWHDSGLPSRLERLENELQDTNAKLHQENILRGDVENRLQREIGERANEQSEHRNAMNQMESLATKVSEAHDKINEMTSSEDRQRRVAEDLRAQVQEQVSRIDELEGELQSEKYRLTQLDLENGDLRAQVNDVNADLSRIRQQSTEREAQYAAEQGQRVSEQEAMQQYSQAKERELYTAIEEKRSLELMHVDALRAVEAQFQYKLETADTRYVQLQHEYENLHELLMRVQQENKAMTERLEAQRGDSNGRMGTLTEALRAADERVHTLMVQHGAAMNQSKDEIQTLQERLVKFCESAVANHEAMQTQVDRLRVMCGHVQGDCDFLKLATDTTRSRVESVQQSVEQPLINFSNECKHKVAKLVAEVQKCQSELEDAKDQISTLSLQKDTEHGQLIMAQDQISRLQFDLNGSQRSRVGDQAHTKEQLMAAQSETTTAKNIIAELENRLQQAMDQLTNANTQNGLLQQECQMTRTSLTETQERQSQEANALKEMLDNMTKQHRKARIECDQIRSELQAVRKQLQIEGQRTSDFEAERHALEKAAHAAHARVRDTETRSTGAIKQMKDELHKLHEQLDTTRDLYTKVRDARDQMRDDNQNLKLEMETFQKNLSQNMRVKGNDGV